jgi:hypothetical protein
MKKLKFLSLLMAVVALMTACNKDDDKTEESGISVQYDGVTWKSTNVSAAYASDSDETVISGANATFGEQIVLSFSGSNTGSLPITESIESPIISFSLGQTGTFTTLFSDNPTGEVVITKFDKEKKLISGTFHCKAEDIDGVEKEFTNGTFTNISYISN